jgi:hypothetical protein
MINFNYKNNTLFIYFNEDKKAGSLVQPHWPDGTPWANETEAFAWAAVFIAAIEDAEAPLAGDGPAEPTKLRYVEPVLPDPELVEVPELAPTLPITE